MSFVIYSRKTGKCWNQNFFKGSWKELCRWNRFCQTLILPLWFVTPPCFLAKIAQISQKVFRHIWIAQRLKIFHTIPWRQDVNWTYIRRSETALGVFWPSYVRSIYILCPGDTTYFFRFRLVKTECQSWIKNFGKIGLYLGEWGPKHLRKRASGCWIGTQNLENF